MLPDVAAVLGIVAFAAVVQGTAGFGFSVLAVPLMAIAVDTKTAVVLSGVISLVTTTIQAVADRRDRDRAVVRRMLAGAIAGSPVGLVALLVVPERGLRLALAVLVLGFVAVSALGVALPAGGTRVDVAAGFASGALNTSLSTNGPPLVMALHPRRLEPRVFRATLATVFAWSNVVSVSLFAVSGRYDRRILLTALAALPALGLGLLAGRAARPLVDGRVFRPLTLGLLAATGVAALVSVLR